MQIRFEKLKKLDFATNEAYKTLRTNITFCGDDVRVITVTSSTPNEGKSNVSFRLASAFAEDQKRTLLIDADIRKSVMVHWLGVDKETLGLSHYLSGKAGMEEVICSTDLPCLDMVFTGPTAPNPTELLGNEKFELLIQKAREEYDYVIVDCPPIGSVIDAAIVAKQCDGAIMVIESAVISYHLAQHVKSQLDKSGCRILGTVLNKVEMNGKGYGYGKYYGRHYRKYYGKYYSND